MTQNELVAELRSMLEDMPSEKLDEILSFLRAENAQTEGTTMPCPVHQGAK